MSIFQVKEGMNEGTWMVGLTDAGYKMITPHRPSGSYNIVAARVLGLSYPDYLRFVRQNYSATLRGREGYSCASYKNRKDCVAVVTLLNDTWRKVEAVIISKMNEVTKGENS